MYPSLPQVTPSEPMAESAIVIGGAPVRVTTLMAPVPSVPKATCWPSGEKDGSMARSVPGIGVAESWLRFRIQSWLPSGLGPVYTSREPSGDRAMRVPRALDNSCPLGRAMAKRSTGRTGAGRIQPHSATTPATAASAQPAIARREGRRPAPPWDCIIAVTDFEA